MARRERQKARARWRRRWQRLWRWIWPPLIGPVTFSLELVGGPVEIGAARRVVVRDPGCSWEGLVQLHGVWWIDKDWREEFCEAISETPWASFTLRVSLPHSNVVLGFDRSYVAGFGKPDCRGMVSWIEFAHAGERATLLMESLDGSDSAFA